MGIALIKIRIMPESPDTDLKKIEKEAEHFIIKEQGTNLRINIEPIAFGLNAIIIGFARDETKDTDDLLKNLQNIDNVSSAEIIDFRRALG